MRCALYALLAVLGGCVVYQVPPTAPAPAAPETPPQAEAPPADAPVADASEDAPAPAVSVYVEPAVVQPAPIVVGWAPPPLLVEVPSPSPFMGAVWVGGYWVWQGNWVWAHGHWMGPPQPSYVWVHPYYEHRGDAVIFIDGHWSAPGVAFVPPPRSLRLVAERPAYGVIPGPHPVGPDGCFVPAPPGSRAGIIVPAPVGTAPAVVTSAPPVIAPGMRITNNVTTVNNNVNNVTNVTNVTRVTNVTNVTIVAPAGATKNGRAFDTMVPAAPHLAAARPALVQARAPEPVSLKPLPVYRPGSQPPVLPNPPPVHAQPVNAGPPPAHPGEALGHDSAHPTPIAFGRDPAHGNPGSARSEHAYPGGYEHPGAPQAQGDHKAPPQPQNANRPAQPQNSSHPAPQAQNQHRNAAPQPQGQQQGQQQGQNQGQPAHAQGDDHSHKTEAQNNHDDKHGQGNEH
ncbi:MAG TPA: hypothetical protein VE819_02385 [Steroidobacteraceae bacterium]|nr:hypothetical protein [Steroidobacteraceae bacterium]